MSGGTVGWRVAAASTWRRVRDVGVGGWVQLERDALLQTAKTALAAALAWALAGALGSELPALASLAAIIILQVTVYQTVTRALQFVVGVVLGLVMALALARLLGVHGWSIGIVIFCSLLLGRALRLGVLVNQVPISALLVLSLGTSYGGRRVVDTVIGAVLGVAVNLLVLPPTYVGAAGRSLRGVAEDLAALCRDVAAAGRAWDHAEARGWLLRAREIDAELRAAGEALDRGEESVRYNPARRAEAEVLARYREALDALGHGTTQVRGFVRTLTDLAERDERWREQALPVLGSLGQLLRAAADATRAFGALQTDEPRQWAADHRLLRASLDQAGRARSEATRHLRELPPGPVQRMLASLVVDAERLLSELDPDEGGHTGAVPRPR